MKRSLYTCLQESLAPKARVSGGTGLRGCEADKQPRGAGDNVSLRQAFDRLMPPRLPHGAASLLRNSAVPCHPARHRIPSWLIGIGVVFLAMMTGCSPQRRDAQGDVLDVLSKQQSAWNAGDVEGFMAGYWRSEELTFSSGGTTTRGWQATLDRYRQRYDTPEKMGLLKFDQIETRALADDVQLVLGQWRLDRDAEPIGGRFTLIFKRIAGRWVIVHDHTSVQATDDAG